MADVHDPQTRSKNMSAIRSGHTKPELAIRKALHNEGLRYRLHAKDLPGTPDLVFPRYKAAVFVHGCFWHRHSCHLFRWPATRREFWEDKLSRNLMNDEKAIAALSGQGWRVAVVWECALKGRTRISFETLVQTLAEWIRSSGEWLVIEGA